MTTMDMTANDSSDFAALLARAQTGDREAKGELLEPLRDFLHMLAVRQSDARLSGRIDASDIVHETYVRALSSLEQFRGSQRPEFLAWLRTVHEHVVQNLAREHILAQKRSTNRERQFTDSNGPQLAAISGSTPSGNLMQAEIILHLIHALDSLPSDQREAIRLRYFESQSLDNIALQMERSHPSVAGLLKRGLQSLRGHFLPSATDSSVMPPAAEEPRP
ncbi:sigma-70 family RNA polymerase sigma factor [Anatilimnocola sp. NA78]|uniref:sigma-70 family RNA polymerase sigma factor n=1 Tax=Anatilimnocola sp. NA78 TaxID=3415683 RepID=UPI003CE57702